ncbi:MAG: ferredoxin [Calditrichaeota bacterium]|nr:MAG: ferredoxin [Calditrichota bacterium]
MKVKIDADLCTGCELCVDTCPDVFEMGDGIAVVKTSQVPAGLEEDVKECVDSCPSEAIIVS